MHGHPSHYISNSEAETREIAFKFGTSLPKNSVVSFCGELGAGKTTFVKGMAAAIAQCHPDEVSSPTFTYLNIYHGPISVYHFDLYRLKDEEAFLSMGFDEFFSADGVCCVEWSERITSLIPKNGVHVVLKHLTPEKREIEIFWGVAI